MDTIYALATARGRSGLAVVRISGPAAFAAAMALCGHLPPLRSASLRRLTWPNGAVATLYSAAAPENLRGPEHHVAWCDELAKWRQGATAWDNLVLGMRLGEGSGCPLAFRVVEAACAVMNTMATFPEAAIDDGYLTEIRERDSFTV